MSIRIFAAAFVSIVALNTSAGAQGIVKGAEQGAHDGTRAAGPVGGLVGGVVGAVGGGVSGLLGLDQRPRFREYVIREHHESYVYGQPVVVGGTLPDKGIVYYEVPVDYGLNEYRYTVINGQPVLVDPKTHRIVEVLD